MEDVVFGQGKYAPNQSIIISELQQIIINKLGMEFLDAQNFARFLIEEKDEDQPEIDTIVFDKKRSINSQYIPIRLMTSFKHMPALFT